MNKTDGVAGGESAEALAESVHTQHQSPQRCHQAILPAADHIPV